MCAKRLAITAILSCIVGVVLLGGRLLAANAQTAREPAAAIVAPNAAYGEGDFDGRAPEISVLESPSATCYRPVTQTGACYIQWPYLRVQTDASSSIISMTVSIDEQIRAYHSGFFQTVMVVPGEMYGQGFEVTCGLPQARIQPGLGATYGYVIRARDANGRQSANVGSVTCPADTVRTHLPAIYRR